MAFSGLLMSLSELHRLSFSHALAATFCLILGVCEATNLFPCLNQRPGGRFAIPVTADVSGWFWEKTVDNGNKLFAVCTPAAAGRTVQTSVQCGHRSSRCCTMTPGDPLHWSRLFIVCSGLTNVRFGGNAIVRLWPGKRPH